MKKRYIVTAATAIAASLAIGCTYGPPPDNTMYTPDDGIVVERAEPEVPAAEAEELPETAENEL